MDIRIAVEELCNAGQGGFDLFIAGTRSSNGYDADGGGEFVIDPVIQLVQQHVLLRDQRRRVNFGHGILLISRNQCATGAGPPSFTLRRISASGTAAAEINISVQKTSM